ncbi:MAG: adenosine deaminase family protein [Gemmatimonadota bacterium]|jgi:adenosine deaminase|nr:adenosine deaminase family protein [Gemmatimonadota bacterium]
MSSDPHLPAFIQSLPKTETHLHIEGALPWELLHQLEPARFPEPPESWADDFRFRSFAHFEDELLKMGLVWFTSPERYHEAAKLIFQRHVEQNVKYVETSFASGVVQFGGVNGEAIAEAIQAAAPEGLTVRVFMGIHRNGYTERSRAFLDRCMEWKYLDGIDLHGPEVLPLEDWTPRLWRRMVEGGKRVKAHAGEFGGAENVRQAIDQLGVRRVQHGVRAIEDPDLVRRLADEGVILDICPISNVKLGVVKSFAEHPLRKFLDAGVVCTVSTDDPVSFGNTLTGEYQLLAEEMGFTRLQLAEVARNGFLATARDAGVGEEYIRELDRIIAGEKARY